jgi:hypothetical protein
MDGNESVHPGDAAFGVLTQYCLGVDMQVE